MPTLSLTHQRSRTRVAHASISMYAIDQLPPELPGVHPPEALPAAVRTAILADLKKRGFAASVVTC